MNINPYSVLPLLASVGNFSLFLFVFLRNRKSTVNITFALSNLCLAIWNFSLFKIYSSSDKLSALFWDRLLQPGLIFIPPLFFHFVLVITKDFTRRKKKLTFAAYAVSFGLAIIAIYNKGLFIKDLAKYDWGYYPVAGPFSHLFNLMFAFFMLYGFYLLFKEYRTTQSAVRKNQFKYLLSGVGIAIAGGISNILVVASGINVYPVGNMAIILYSSLITYAIIKYRLMEINILLKKWAIYLTVVAFSAGVSFLIVQLSVKILGRDVDKSLLLELCFVITIAVFASFRLYPKARDSARRIFSSEKYKYRNTFLTKGKDSIVRIEQLGNRILSDTGQDVNNLINGILTELSEILEVSSGCMFLPEVKGENDIVYTNAYGIEVEKNTSIQNNSPLIDILLALKEPIVREELELKANFDYSGQIEKEKLLVAAVELAELEAEGSVEDYTRRLNEQLKAQYHKDRDHIDKLEDANGQLCFNLDEARQVVEARDDQAAIDKDFIRQYQEQVEELQDALKSISEAASHGNLYHIDAPDNCAKIAGIAQGLLAQPQESDK